jgi:hypothetical protein
MRKIFPFLLGFVLIMSMPIFAFADDTTAADIEYLDDGSYFVTTIEEYNPGPSLFAAASTKSGYKQTTYYSSSGASLWYVRVTGTFSYTGSSSYCTNSAVTAASQSSYWTVSDKYASYSGNTATASATGRCYDGSVVIQTITRTASLSCSANGTLS